MNLHNSRPEPVFMPQLKQVVIVAKLGMCHVYSVTMMTKVGCALTANLTNLEEEYDHTNPG